MRDAVLRSLSKGFAALGAALLIWPACSGEPPPIAKPTPTVTASASASADPPPPPPPDDKHAVATEAAEATEVALAVLRKGGSAVDAAIAATFATGVVHPVSSGLGGGGFAMIWDPKKKETFCLDFRETAPIGLRPADFATRPAPAGKRGVMVGTPGEVAGLHELHARYGKLAMSDLVRGAAGLAENGFKVSLHLSRSIAAHEDWIKKEPRYSAVFHPTGALLAAGAVAKNAPLAATLKRIGAEGKAAFYEGAIAKDIVDTAKAGKSPMLAKELKDYAPIARDPIKVPWETYEVVTMPPPSAGGILLAETLGMHDRATLEKLGYNSAAYVHLLAETFRGAIADRVRAVGDPGFVKLDVAKLVSKERMRARRRLILPDATRAAEKFPLEEHGTMHLVVVDQNGMVASLTSTVNGPFGSHLITSGGFPLNDQLDDFTPEPVYKRFGVKKGPNVPRGGARPVSSMIPTIVFSNGSPVLALGGSGSMRIATGSTEVLLAHLVFGRGVAEAVSDPRFDAPPMGGLHVDRGFDAEVKEGLGKTGEVVDDTRVNFSAIQAVSIRVGGGRRVLEAGADPRKGGSAVVE
jgi:gamma-glutamyltranspeptidase/glutathione hydrolase